jgi:hypothetical protein
MRHQTMARLRTEGLKSGREPTFRELHQSAPERRFMAKAGPTLNWRSEPPLIGLRRAEVDPQLPFGLLTPQ